MYVETSGIAQQAIIRDKANVRVKHFPATTNSSEPYDCDRYCKPFKETVMLHLLIKSIFVNRARICSCYCYDKSTKG